MVLSVLAAFATFPGILKTFKGDRGAEALNNFSSNDNYFTSLGLYLDTIQEKMLYGIKDVFLLLLITGFVLLVVYAVHNNKKETLESVISKLNLPILALAFAWFSYMLIIVKISPFFADRYYFGVTPIFWLLVIYVIIKGWNYVLKKSYLASIVFCMIMIFSTVCGYHNGKIMYQFQRQSNDMDKLQQYKGSSCVYITNGREYTVTEYALELQKFNEIKVIDTSRYLLDNMEIHDEKNTMIAYIDENLNQEETIEKLKEKTEYTRVDLLFRGSGIWWEEADEIYVYALKK